MSVINNIFSFSHSGSGYAITGQTATVGKPVTSPKKKKDIGIALTAPSKPHLVEPYFKLRTFDEIEDQTVVPPQTKVASKSFKDIFTVRIISNENDLDKKTYSPMSSDSSLNWSGKMPILSSITGSIRIVSSIISTIYSLGLIFLTIAKNSNLHYDLQEVAFRTAVVITNGYEILRGSIEIIPIIGNMIMLIYDKNDDKGYFPIHPRFTKDQRAIINIATSLA